MFSWFQSKQPQEKTELICLVTSFAVTAAIVRTYQGEGSVQKPVVLFSRSERVHPRKAQTEQDLMNRVAQATKRVLEPCRRAWGNFEKMTCVIGEPWTITLSRSIHQEKPQAFRITEKMVQELIMRDRKVFESEVLFQNEEEMGLVQVSRPQVRLNGYLVSDYNNQKATTLDIHLAYSIAPAIMLDEITGAFIDVFHRDDVTFASMDLARARIYDQDPVIAIDLGGMSSVISLIREGHPTHHIRVGKGLSDLYDSLAQDARVPDALASSFMRMTADENVLDENKNGYFAQVHSGYRPIGDLLLRGLREINRNAGVVPRKAFISGGVDWIETLHPLIAKDLEMESVQNFPRDQVIHLQGYPSHPNLDIAIIHVIH